MPALPQVWTPKIIQNIIILDQNFPTRPHYRYPSHWHPLLTTKFQALSVTQFLMGALSILWNSNLHHAALLLSQGLSCSEPLSSFCLIHTGLSKIIRGIKSQWTVWKRASIEIILIDIDVISFSFPEKETQLKRNGRSYFVTLVLLHGTEKCTSELEGLINTSYVLELEEIRVHENAGWKYLLDTLRRKNWEDLPTLNASHFTLKLGISPENMTSRKKTI